jgi:hypothetical protein
MKAQETAPLLTRIAPAALAAPPVVIFGVLVGVGLLWLLSVQDKADKAIADAEKPLPDLSGLAESEPDAPPLSTPTLAAKRVTREDLAEALAYGERAFTRKEAVVALEALGFRKTSAYKAVSPNGKFASLIEFTPDDLIEWKG